MIDSTGVVSLVWPAPNGRKLYGSDGNPHLDWNNRLLWNGGLYSVDWGRELLLDVTGSIATTIDWGAKTFN